jgi:Domain of unknown function DUF29
MSNHELYEQDFFAWTQCTAALLRQACGSAVDMEAVAEEIESLGKSDFRELNTRITRILQHFLKWQFQPGHRSDSWTDTVSEQRIAIEGILEQSPSLRRHLDPCLGKNYRTARRFASRETRIHEDRFPAECPYSIDQITDPGYLPE